MTILLPLPTSRPRSHPDQTFAKQAKNVELGLARVTHAVRNARRVVVIAGAGISTPAIPDFRSSNGLFKTLGQASQSQQNRSEPHQPAQGEWDAQEVMGGNGKGKAREVGAGIRSGKELFDVKCLTDPSLLPPHHRLLTSLHSLTLSALPTPFHHLLKTIDGDGKLLRVYTQNIDGLEGKVGLDVRVPEVLEKVRAPRKERGRKDLGSGVEGEAEAEAEGSGSVREVGQEQPIIPTEETAGQSGPSASPSISPRKMTPTKPDINNLLSQTVSEEGELSMTLDDEVESQIPSQSQSQRDRSMSPERGALYPMNYSQDTQVDEQEERERPARGYEIGLEAVREDEEMEGLDPVYSGSAPMETQRSRDGSATSVSNLTDRRGSISAPVPEPPTTTNTAAASSSNPIPPPTPTKTSRNSSPAPPMPRCVPLHGLLSTMTCTICPHSSPLSSHVPLPPTLIPCPSCSDRQTARIENSERPRSSGFLRADVVLYGEEHRHGEAIGRVVERDVRGGGGEGRMDLLIVAGTTLHIPGVKRMIKEFSRVLRSTGGGRKKAGKRRAKGDGDEEGTPQEEAEEDSEEEEDFPIRTIYLNMDPPGKGASRAWADVFDIWVQGDLQDFARSCIDSDGTLYNELMAQQRTAKLLRDQEKRKIVLGEGGRVIDPKQGFKPVGRGGGHAPSLMLKFKFTKPGADGKPVKAKKRKVDGEGEGEGEDGVPGTPKKSKSGRVQKPSAKVLSDKKSKPMAKNPDGTVKKRKRVNLTTHEVTKIGTPSVASTMSSYRSPVYTPADFNMQCDETLTELSTSDADDPMPAGRQRERDTTPSPTKGRPTPLGFRDPVHPTPLITRAQPAPEAADQSMDADADVEDEVVVVGLGKGNGGKRKLAATEGGKKGGGKRKKMGQGTLLFPVKMGSSPQHTKTAPIVQGPPPSSSAPRQLVVPAFPNPLAPAIPEPQQPQFDPVFLVVPGCPPALLATEPSSPAKPVLPKAARGWAWVPIDPAEGVLPPPEKMLPADPLALNAGGSPEKRSTRSRRRGVVV